MTAGAFLTVAYMGFLFWLRASKFSSFEQAITALRTLPINNLGDFLAGVFGPVSFLWLVIGYFQQQKELTLNTNALKLQADELAKQVIQHKELVKVTREQLEHERTAFDHERERIRKSKNPAFALVKCDYVAQNGDDYYYKLVITNSGGPAFKVSLKTDGSLPQIDSVSPVEFWGGNEIKEFGYRFKHGELPRAVDLKILCIDAEGEAYEKAIKLMGNGTTFKTAI